MQMLYSSEEIKHYPFDLLLGKFYNFQKLFYLMFHIFHNYKNFISLRITNNLLNFDYILVV